MRHLRSVNSIGKAACVALALAVIATAPSSAQVRPTLNGVETQVDQQQSQIDQQQNQIAEQSQRLASLEAIMCVNTIDDSFRPLGCDPTCNCSEIEGFSSPTSGACQETSHGEFALSATVVTNYPGTCGVQLPPSCVDGGGVAVCNNSSGTLCTGEGDCSGGEVCFLNFCRRLCTTPADCPGVVVISGLCDRQTFCTSNLDCLIPGDSCADHTGLGTLFCSQSCAVDADCDVSTSDQYAVAISGVGAVTSVDAASCNGAPITSRDALECVAIAEAGLGSCTFLCGDGNVQAGEECDDGNRASGDGCDAACHLES